MTDTHTVDGLSVPRTATTAEAAAIAAAVESYLGERRAAADEEATDEGWDGERFAFAGRLEALGASPRRVPRTAPTDRWTAAARADRY